MKFSELMKALGHEDLNCITKYGEIKEYQDEYFYTINSQTSDLMQEIKSKVSEKKPMFPYLSDNKSLSDIDKPRPYNLMCKDEQFLKVNQNWV